MYCSLVLSTGCCCLFKKIYFRRFPQSALSAFRRRVWALLVWPHPTSSFTGDLMTAVDTFFPSYCIKIYPSDKPWMSLEITRSLHSGFKRSGADLVTTMTSIDWNQWLILSGKLRTAPTTHVQTKWHRYKNLEEKRKYQTQRRTSCILSKKIPHHPRFQFQASWIYF